MTRLITHRYIDPLDAIWLGMAKQLGWTIERSAEVYASSDGAGRVSLGTTETLDQDDCLAQMIFHELCHACVQGPLATQPDWGLDNTTARDVAREHGCLRLQAFVAGTYGLRRVLAPTTDFRAFYDRLPPDPLADTHEPTVAMAQEGLGRLRAASWSNRLEAALHATRTIAWLAHDFAVSDTAEEPPALWALVDTTSPTEGSQNSS